MTHAVSTEHDLAFFERQLSKYVDARSPWERAMATTYAGLLLGARSASVPAGRPDAPAIATSAFHE